MKIDPYLIQYLESSQGLRFKKIPTLYKTQKSFSRSVLSYDEYTGKIKLSKIYIQNNLFKKGREKSRDLVILHEAREILITQNNISVDRDLTQREKSMFHIRALKHESEDKRFLNRYYDQYEEYDIHFPKEMYNLEDYMKVRRDR